jgi:uncharacterized protein (TIGR02996 family)
MREENTFLMAIRANPEDDPLRLIYADWLEERGDARADFVRLHLALKSLSPDHPHRAAGEQELSALRQSASERWLGAIEPEHVVGWKLWQGACECFAAGHEARPWPEMEFHLDTQDTECAAWKRLLTLIEQAAADGREELAPLRDMTPEEREQIITLPPTIAKLKSVRVLYLYGSHLVRIPPEIGEMSSLVEFDPYTSYWLHWFPYEITRCANLADSRVSTRALYGNYKYRPPFPRLQPRMVTAAGRVEPEGLSLKSGAPTIRNCSVCNRPYEDRRLHRVWITLRVATHDLPLLVNACSEDCIRKLPRPTARYYQHPHRGGREVPQPPASYV